MKQYVKTLNTDDDSFKYTCRQFPDSNKEKLKQGIFDDAEIRQPGMDAKFV